MRSFHSDAAFSRGTGQRRGQERREACRTGRQTVCRLRLRAPVVRLCRDRHYTPICRFHSNAGAAVYQPDLRGSSFQTFNSYYMWNNYYSYLSTSFDVSPVYFDRFYRNTEPLITPGMLKLTLREPIRLSSEMLDSIDRLQEMLEAGLSGASTDRQALVDKSRHVRELAKRIRQNQTLSYIDLRENKNLYPSGEHDAFSPEAMQSVAWNGHGSEPATEEHVSPVLYIHSIGGQLQRAFAGISHERDRKDLQRD